MRNIALRSFLVPAETGYPGPATPIRPNTSAPGNLTSPTSQLPGLTRDERNALHLVEVERASYHQVGQRLGISCDNVKHLVFDGRRKIYGSIGGLLTAAVA